MAVLRRSGVVVSVLNIETKDGVLAADLSFWKRKRIVAERYTTANKRNIAAIMALRHGDRINTKAV